MEVNYLDLIIALPIVLLAITGFRNGFIKELASLAALILGIYFAIYFSDVVAGWLMEIFDVGHRWIFIVAFILTFIGVVIVVSFIGKLLSKVASLAALGIFNKLLGMLFGVAKGVLVMSLLILLFNMIDSKSSILKEDVKKGSLLYVPVQSVVPLILVNLENIDFDDPSWDDFKDSAKKSNLEDIIEL